MERREAEVICADGHEALKMLFALNGVSFLLLLVLTHTTATTLI